MNFLTRIFHRNNANQITYTVSTQDEIDRALEAHQQQRQNELQAFYAQRNELEWALESHYLKQQNEIRAKLELTIQQCNESIQQLHDVIQEITTAGYGAEIPAEIESVLIPRLIKSREDAIIALRNL